MKFVILNSVNQISTHAPVKGKVVKGCDCDHCESERKAKKNGQ